ncbi:DUF3842 family protein [Anoxybacterium hadale]|uniref:DUF3842 family protein n=1 Tax=Anoxybacterium hadale TaxID=3408580 RepID=A0ACD1AI05_9FIRM|nr:DUF3842 family protein [Clostridiales bacterium]
MKIAVIDGQEGGIGRQIIEEIRQRIYWDIQIIALGTNSLATSFMVQGGANVGATGENAVQSAAPKVDLILGSVGIIAANSMKGEVTEAMALAVVSSPARKFLIPHEKSGIKISGVDESLNTSQLIEKAVKSIKALYYEEKNGGSVAPSVPSTYK